MVLWSFPTESQGHASVHRLEARLENSLEKPQLCLLARRLPMRTAPAGHAAWLETQTLGPSDCFQLIIRNVFVVT